MSDGKRTRSDDTADRRSHQDDRSRPDQPVLVPIDDFRPGMTVRVVGPLPASITIHLLRLPNGETVPVLERPDEYTGYVVRSRLGDEQVDSTTVAFTRGALDLDAAYTVLADVQVFSEQLKLFRASLRTAEDSEGEDDDSDDEDDGSDDG